MSCPCKCSCQVEESPEMAEAIPREDKKIKDRAFRFVNEDPFDKETLSVFYEVISITPVGTGRLSSGSTTLDNKSSGGSQMLHGYVVELKQPISERRYTFEINEKERSMQYELPNEGGNIILVINNPNQIKHFQLGEIKRLTFT